MVIGLVERIARQHRMKRAGRGYVGTCPGCNYQGAFSMSVGEDGRLLLHCHIGCRLQEIRRALGEIGDPDHAGHSFISRNAVTNSSKDQSDLIQRLITMSIVAHDGVVQVYLNRRGITLAPPPDIRCLLNHRHTPSGRRYPVMLGLVRDIDGCVNGLHRIFIALDGTSKAAVEPAKMSVGQIARGAVRLHRGDSNLQQLAVSEGIETGLSVAQATRLPVWAALSAGGIEQLVLPPLPAAQHVLIFADRDHHGRGQRAAERAAERFAGQGRSVRVVLPPNVGTDFNDLLQAAGR